MKNKIRISIITLLILFLSIINIIMPIKSFSSQENRYLQKLPNFKFEEFISGKYGSDFEKYTTDQFPYRDFWIKLKTSSDLFILKKDNGRVYFGNNDYLFDVDSPFDEGQFHKNMDYINNFIYQIKLLDKEIKIGAVLIPSKGTVLSDYLPPYAPIIDESKLVRDIISSLPEDFYILDLIDTLKDKSNEYIYYRTDHHWTTNGAYYAYNALSNFLDYNPYSKNMFVINEVNDDFLGTIYRKANLYKGDPDSIYRYSPLEGNNYKITINEDIKIDNLYDKSYLTKTDKYSYFLGGDFGVVDIETSVDNGKTLVILKDSFANSLLPFLTLHYEKIVMIDTRYFGASITEYIKDMDVSDIIFAFNTQNFSQMKTFNLLKR